MGPRSLFLPFLLALAAPSLAQRVDVGEAIPTGLVLENFSQSGAQTLEDYTGRAILVEFFAYW